MRRSLFITILVATACGTEVDLGHNETSTSAGTGGSSESGDGDGDGDGDLTPKLDVDPGDGDGDACKVGPDAMDAAPPCEDKAPPNSFDPEVQWTWSGPEAMKVYDTYTTPLVANLTDDNDDGAIDLCDIPDIVVVAGRAGPGEPFNLFVLDGATGSEHWRADLPLHFATPAIGDIDDDGVPEIVAIENLDPMGQGCGPCLGPLVAFEDDGTVKWQGDGLGSDYRDAAVALADLDNDGSVEIFAGNGVFDSSGSALWTMDAQAGGWNATTAADLDDDGSLEVIGGTGQVMFADGTEYFSNPDVFPAGAAERGFPQVADLDDDGRPEILYSMLSGITVLEHDGSTKYSQRMTLAADQGYDQPAAIHDMDGDGSADFAVSSHEHYGSYHADASLIWQALIDDPSGLAGGTAFDFLGDATAEAMYADTVAFFAFDDVGEVLLSVARRSGTAIEYPVVADVDGDDSAEVIVVSNLNYDDGPTAPTVQVIRDVEDRWVGARRIWNQHTYHVTNVREDGTIPRFELPHWKQLNTFRTQAQRLPSGGTCQPEPEG